MKKFLKLCNHSKVKMVIILTFLFFAYTTIYAISYADDISTDIANSVFRLHVIANSDSDVDQNLKYIVRDNLLEYMNTLCANCTSKEEAITIANVHIEDFKEIALNTIRDEGFDYSVNVSIGNFEFPTKHYGDISLPSGYYDALKVENSLTDEEFSIVSDNEDSPSFKLKFKILEILNDTGLITAKK